MTRSCALILGSGSGSGSSFRHRYRLHRVWLCQSVVMGHPSSFAQADGEMMQTEEQAGCRQVTLNALFFFSGDAANSCEPGRLSFLATLVVCDRKCSIEKQRWEVVAGVRGDKWPTRRHPRVTRRPKLCSNLKFTPGDAFGLL